MFLDLERFQILLHVLSGYSFEYTDNQVWGCGSVSRVFAKQAQNLGFNPQHHIKTSTVLPARNCSMGGGEGWGVRGDGGNGDRDTGSEVQDHPSYKESLGSSLGYVRLFQK